MLELTFLEQSDGISTVLLSPILETEVDDLD